MEITKTQPPSPLVNLEDREHLRHKSRPRVITGKRADGQPDQRLRSGKACVNFKHGWSCTPTMNCWKNMIRRCYDPNAANYKYYGGVGRRVCEKLRNGILDFVEIAGKRPDGLQIDRIDNNGHYSCGKCVECDKEGWSMNLRWTTRKVQCRNRKNTPLLKIDGVTKPIGDWAEERGVPDWKIYNDAIAGRLGELIGSKNRDCVAL